MTEQKKIALILDGIGNIPVSRDLESLSADTLFHKSLNCRHPLGIYNVSVARLFRKITKCAEHAEKVHRAPHIMASPSGNEDLENDLIDYIELVLYAAAEHVDDIELITRCFFLDGKAYKRDRRVKHFANRIKLIRDRLCALTNAIKHNHGRIRLFYLEFFHEDSQSLLFGFFVEGVNNEVVGPSPILHSESTLISISSFLWSVVIYVLRMSEELRDFLKHFANAGTAIDAEKQYVEFERCIAAVSNLPIYFFDSENPFNFVDIRIDSKSEWYRCADDAIYGSPRNPWKDSTRGFLGGWRLGYVGDGVTKSFKWAGPSNLKIHNLPITK